MHSTARTLGGSRDKAGRELEETPCNWGIAWQRAFDSRRMPAPDRRPRAQPAIRQPKRRRFGAAYLSLFFSPAARLDFSQALAPGGAGNNVGKGMTKEWHFGGISPLQIATEER